ncbi:MAG: hypothetical protein PHV20_12400 [Bacteroidales bacterium]|nr:hypothetical protein [Bacteroidales bacterium]
MQKSVRLNLNNEILDWFSNGKNPIEGLSLLRRTGGNPFLIKFISTNPKANIKLITDNLKSYTDKHTTPNEVPLQLTKTETQRKTSKVIREEYAFLLNADCPIELKLLVNQKFNTFHVFSKLHNQLADCTTLEECADKAASIIDNYIENRMIFAELDYYRDTKTLLGKHPIFKEFVHLKQLRTLNQKDLYIKKRSLEHNIWRIKSEIDKGDKTHLDTERRIRLENKSAQLAEIERLIE